MMITVCAFFVIEFILRLCYTFPSEGETMGKEKNRVTRIALIFAAVYMVSYLTRINFGAIVSEMEQATSIPKNLLSLSLTGSFVTYGIGQVFSGITVDRFSPKRLISVGLLVTAVMNLLIPFCNSPYTMLGVWCVNGFAQSMMWPPIVKMMSQMFSQQEYQKAAVIVSWGSSVGTIVIYVFSPVILTWLNWQWVFVVCSCVALVTLLLWQFFPYKPQEFVYQEKRQKGSKAVFLSPLLLGIMAAIVLQGMLRDGVTTWMPSYIVETYHWSTAASILTGVILPVFSILSFQISARLYRKVFTNPLLCAGVFFAVGFLSAVGLYFATGGNAALSVLLSAILTGAMHGVNMMLISMLPPFFKRYGLTGTASGVLNSCTYVGSALSTYGVAAISEKAGWGITILIWVGIACLGTIVCFACIKGFQRKFMQK